MANGWCSHPMARASWRPMVKYQREFGWSVTCCSPTELATRAFPSGSNTIGVQGKKERHVRSTCGVGIAVVTTKSGCSPWTILRQEFSPESESVDLRRVMVTACARGLLGPNLAYRYSLIRSSDDGDELMSLVPRNQ